MTMSDDDLIRRGDVLAAVLDAMRKHVYPRYTDAIAAIPAVTPSPVNDAPRDAVIREIAAEVAKWRNDTPMTGAECAAGILHHFLPHPPEGGSDE
jgi:hypothetical protein